MKIKVPMFLICTEIQFQIIISLKDQLNNQVNKKFLIYVFVLKKFDLINHLK